MFTVKHIAEDGSEHVFQASDVHRTAEGVVVFGQEKTIDSGKAYVMNEAGKTVAVYDEKDFKEKKL